MNSFFNFDLWISPKLSYHPLPVVTLRMQVFFWIKRKVYQPVENTVKASLKMSKHPLYIKRSMGSYLVKHTVSKTDSGEMKKATVYKNDMLMYLRHPASARKMSTTKTNGGK